jgi:hypothetical protein
MLRLGRVRLTQGASKALRAFRSEAGPLGLFFLHDGPLGAFFYAWPQNMKKATVRIVALSRFEKNF